MHPPGKKFHAKLCKIVRQLPPLGGMIRPVGIVNADPRSLPATGASNPLRGSICVSKSGGDKTNRSHPRKIQPLPPCRSCLPVARVRILRREEMLTDRLSDYLPLMSAAAKRTDGGQSLYVSGLSTPYCGFPADAERTCAGGRTCRAGGTPGCD